MGWFAVRGLQRCVIMKSKEIKLAWRRELAGGGLERYGAAVCVEY